MPGSGKSTYAATLGPVVLSADAYRSGASGGALFADLYRRLGAELGQSHDAVCDVSALRACDREALRRIGVQHDARCVLVFFCVSWPICRERYLARKRAPRINWYEKRQLAAQAFKAIRGEGWDEVVYYPKRLEPALFLWSLG